MRFRHDSRNLRFRTPFGAVPAGTVVELSCEIEPDPDAGVPSIEVLLHYAYGLERFVQSVQRTVPTVDGHLPIRCATHLRMPGEPGLLFYWFEVRLDLGNKDARDSHASGSYYLIGPSDRLGGEGSTSPLPPEFLADAVVDRHPFQITVFDPTFHAPEWVKGAVVYQIFPDRYARGAEFSADSAQNARLDASRILHAEWDEEVDFVGLPGLGYTASDFYGGTLDGIRENLDSLVSLGVGVLYLNPVFESRSNHRYDTADYRRIDPMLGDESAFRALCDEAARRGIRIVLDGVFSHTGDDSRYFNRLKTYDTIGAYQEAEGKGLSPYRSWYGIRKAEDGRLLYDSWWGFDNLPAVHENDLSFKEFLFGEDGVLRFWLERGAAGFRLDVSDELPDGFLREFRTCVRSIRPDAFTLGEVWEDASRKVSYGSYRDFLLGRTHDSVMGYPFREALLGWLTDGFDAAAMDRRLESIRENYPADSFHAAMTLLGSHDVTRALTALSGLPDPGDRTAQAAVRLSEERRELARERLRLAVAFQMTYPGAPSIYYGDEAGMEGFRDPFNRRTYPWGREDQDLLAFFRDLGSLRASTPVLRTGHYETLEAEGDRISFRRFLVEGRDAFGRTVEGPREIVATFDRALRRARLEADGKPLRRICP
jgi:4-alpha-glucanotransferase